MPLPHVFLILLVTLIWGCNFIFIKLGVQEVPPIFLCALRFFLASVPAIFFIRFPKEHVKMVMLYGLVMFALQFSLLFIGMSLGITAGITALILQTAVFFSIFFAAIFLREMPTLWQMLGALLSFTGIAIAATHFNNASMPLSGFLFILGCAIASGVGNLITRQLGHINAMTLLSWGCFIAFPPLLLLSLMVEGYQHIAYSLHHLSWLTVISLSYIVYLSTWVGYGTWTWLLGRYPVSTVVPFSLLIPMFAMLSSVLFLHERFETWKLTVSGLVIAGLCINLFVPRLLHRRRQSIVAIEEESLADLR